jgi:uracil-DNA glycosylase
MAQKLEQLLSDIAACTICKAHLPDDVYPVIRVDARAQILIAGQAPGRVVYETGLPFKDKSGDRLREWLGVDDELFYDRRKFAFLPMGLCFPGTGKSGDFPPRPECAQTWHEQVIAGLPAIKLIVAVGQYAIKYHLGDRAEKTLTATVQNWHAFAPDIIPLPHPSPRNNLWLRKNPWFEDKVLPVLRARVAKLL